VVRRERKRERERERERERGREREGGGQGERVGTVAGQVPLRYDRKESVSIRPLIILNSNVD